MRLPVSAVILLLALLSALAGALACDAVQPQPSPAAAPTPAVAQVSPTAAVVPSASGSAVPTPALPGTLPNRNLTPGETFAGVTAEQVCVAGYARRARNVLPEQYPRVYASYGIAYPEPAGTYELDHLVPLELGGDNGDRNLWPEPALPFPGFPEKDRLENYLHNAVCLGRMALADAQTGIASDWIALYRLYLQT